MLQGLIGRKVGMTQLFSDDGDVIPVTAIEAGPCWVVQKKTTERDGYTAVQLGFGAKKVKRVTIRDDPSLAKRPRAAAASKMRAS